MRLIDADKLADGLKLRYKYTDQDYERDRWWTIGYNAGLDHALYSIACARTIAPQPNPPLALEDLRGMDGQWVWCESDKTPEYSGWCKVDATAEWPNDTIACGVECDVLCIDIVLAAWKAYRRKPEEGTQSEP